MNKTKVTFLIVTGLTMIASGLSASATEIAAKAMPMTGMAGQSQRMHSMHDSCKHEHHMMPGHGYAHGMMGGMGMMGGGMMMESPRAGMVRSLNLSDAQRTSVNKLSDKLHHDNWAAMGKIMDESTKLRDLYEMDRRNPDAIAEVYKKIFALKVQMIKAMVTTENQIEDLLTKGQRAQLKAMRQHMGMGPMMHGGHPMMY